MSDSKSTLDDEVDDEGPEDTRETCWFWDSRNATCHFESLIQGSGPCASCPEPEPGPDAHDGPCIYCEHGPYCLTCPPPPVITDDSPVCGRCREEITCSEIAADPYYSGGAVFGDGA